MAGQVWGLDKPMPWVYDNQFWYIKQKNPWWKRMFGKKKYEVVKRPTEYKELFDGRPQR